MYAFSRWANRNPLLAVWLGFIAVLVLLLVAAGWDAHESRAVRQQISTNTRSST